jgi:nucleoside-diphosphate-sugar epimerase
MNVLVTGANGFVGRAVVAAAIEAGHDLVALVRPAATLRGAPWDAGRLRVVRGDLRERGSWVDEIGPVDAVAHLAAATSGDLGTQFQGTVLATENLLLALDLGVLRRFVHVSSLAVYDYGALATGARLDEAALLERVPERRDPYTITKLFQERMVREALRSTRIELVVLRPGAVFGAGRLWNHGAALRLGRRVALIFAPGAGFRLTYVENCADAIVAALTEPRAAGRTVNIVDDGVPTHGAYRRMCRDAGAAVPFAIPVPWLALVAAGACIDWWNHRWLGGRAVLPEFLSLPRQQARWRPLRYSNQEAKAVLGWRPRVAMREAVERAVLGDGADG